MIDSGIYTHDTPLPTWLQGTHRGRPPWPSLRATRALIWLSLSLYFLCAVSL